MIIMNISGRIVRNAETIATQTGKQFVKFVVASNGRKKDEVDYVEVLTGLVNLAPYLTKGSVVSVVGHPKASAYVNKQNVPIGKITVSASQVELISRGSSATAPAQAPQVTASQATVPAQAPQASAPAQAPAYAPQQATPMTPVYAPQGTEYPEEEIPF